MQGFLRATQAFCLNGWPMAPADRQRPTCSTRGLAMSWKRKKPPGGPDGFCLGGLSRIRTLDLLIKSQLLYQLS